MDWNVIIPFIGFGGIITLGTILYKFSYKNGRQDCRLDYLEKRVFANEEKSISSTNNTNSDITDLKDMIAKGFNETRLDIKSLKDDIKSLDGRVTKLEKFKKG